MGSAAYALIIPMIWAGWILGLHIARRKSHVHPTTVLASTWRAFKIFLVLSVTFAVCGWLTVLPAAPSLVLLVALLGCSLAGYEFGRSNAKTLL